MILVVTGRPRVSRLQVLVFFRQAEKGRTPVGPAARAHAVASN